MIRLQNHLHKYAKMFVDHYTSSSKRFFCFFMFFVKCCCSIRLKASSRHSFPPWTECSNQPLPSGRSPVCSCLGTASSTGPYDREAGALACGHTSDKQSWVRVLQTLLRRRRGVDVCDV